MYYNKDIIICAVAFVLTAAFLFKEEVPLPGYRICYDPVLVTADEHCEEEPSISIPVGAEDRISITDLIELRGPSKYSKEELLEYLSHNKVIERSIYGYIKTGIKPSVLLAMDILESDMRTSSLVEKTNNHGNIKCKCSWNAEKKHLHDKLRKSGRAVCFPGKDKIENSYDRYVVFATQWQAWEKKVNILGNYKVVRNARSKNLTARQWCDVIHKSPYATDKIYNQKLWSRITTLGLEEIDRYVIEHKMSITTQSGKYTLAMPIDEYLNN